ncbi:MAG: AAA family ATPase [Oscillospiraceae bacterium]|nr:AAA family ATPase [Oscillospiraceae bacterium]
MKLTHCHIENFGTLHQYDLELGDGVTVIKAPNGFGKTTFAAFIRAMLYGFPRANKTNLDKDPRRKYSPWQGGSFGGSIEFEAGGKAYRAERFFGDRPAQDSFALYELPGMRPSRRFSENLGLELFGLDADSFERSAFMSRLGETGSLSTGAIQAKLSDLVEDTGDIISYDRAMKSLRDRRRELIPYKGSGGRVNQASDKITSLQAKLAECTSAGKELPGLYSEIEELEASAAAMEQELERLSGEIADASSQETARLLYRQKEALARSCTEAEAELSGLRSKYPAGLPTEAELDRVGGLYTRLGAINEERRKNAEAFFIGKKAAETAPVPEKPAMLPSHLAFVILGVVLLLAGAVLMFMRMFTFGAPALGLGAVLAAVGLYLNSSRLKQIIIRAEQEAAARAEAMQQEYELKVRESELAAEECSAGIDGLFALYSLGSDRDIGVLTSLRNDLLRQERLIADRDRAYSELAGFNAEHPEVTEAPAAAADLQALKSRYAELGRAHTAAVRLLPQKRSSAEAYAELVRSIPETEAALEHWKTVKAEGIKRASELDKAADFLEKAKDSLSRSYMHRIEEGFARYISRLEGEDRAFVNPDLSVKLERSGKLRELEHFSAGSADMIMLCMRLALMDALFREEKPFVLMDDPFVNLDDAHMEKTRELLESLGTECQVIYLVCNSSRC